MNEIVAEYERKVAGYLPKLERFKTPKRLVAPHCPKHTYVLGKLVMIGYYEDGELEWWSGEDMYLIANKQGSQLFVGRLVGSKEFSPYDLVEERRNFAWGNEPHEALVLEVPSLDGARYMGPIAVITYETRKGKGPATQYTHSFSWPLPHLVMARSGIPGIIRGQSKFRVRPEGIVK